jgi:hypothetical protein
MQDASRSFNPFRVLSEQERAAHLDAYLRFLTEREGEVDLPARTMSRREARMQALEQDSVIWTGEVDHAGFQRSMARRRVNRLDPRTQWILAAAKANEGERYGVELEIARYLRRGGFPGIRVPELMLYVLMQEAYHCRILLQVCRTCGVSFESRDPGWANRALLGAIGGLPGRLRWVPVLAAEVVGTAVFRLLLDHLGLFAAQPPIRDRLAACMREIWIDEVLHVAFLRAHLGRPALAVARALVPLIAGATLRDVPQLKALRIGPRQILESLQAGIEIPEEIGWLAPDPFPGPVGLSLAPRPLD